ncbi:MAG TPA: hypothetical protein VHU86_08900 [Solirubrobacterales bacterium]|nr:hypothetical protein [Solirubrobacterales bacterium]
MQLIPRLMANVGWTSFSGVFSTVFPLIVLILVLTIYTVALLRRRGG